MIHSFKTTPHKQKINRTKSKGSTLWLVILALLLGIALGVLSLGLALKSATESSSIQNGAWLHNPYVGSDKASGYTRALVSVIGFLGMTREESIYFLIFGVRAIINYKKLTPTPIKISQRKPL